MKTNFQKVQDFHVKFDVEPTTITADLENRIRFIQEEMREAAEAAADVMKAKPEELAAAKAHLLKEFGDLLYITYGAFVVMGVDADAVFEEIHRSNMSKTKRTDHNGKAIKGPDYIPANMEQFVTGEKSHG
jgi:predicted HAD superfamily Cof-like phosphohydrolase